MRIDYDSYAYTLSKKEEAIPTNFYMLIISLW